MNALQNAFRNIRDQGFTFDVETLGFYNDQPMYSASMAKWGVSTPNTYYFDVRKSLNKASYFGSESWKELTKDGMPKFSSYGNFVDDFISNLNNNKYIVGHNLNFDYGWVQEVATPEQFDTIQNRLWGKDWKENKYLNKNLRAGDGRVGYNIRKGRYTQAYAKLNDYVNLAQREGRVATLDTLSLSNIFTGMAKDAGIIQGDIKAGHTLEYLAESLGIKTKGLAHKEADVLFNQSVFDAFAKDDLGKLNTHLRSVANNDKLSLVGNANAVKRFRGSLSSGGRNFLNALETIDSQYGQQLSDLYFRKAVVLGAASAKNIGSVPLRTIDGRKPELYNIKDQTRLNRVKQWYSQKYERPIEEVEKLWNTTFNSGKSIKQIEQQLEAPSRALKSSIIETIQGLSPTLESGINPGKNIYSKTPMSWKKGLGIAAGIVGVSTLISNLTGGYDAPPPTRISSNDDDYNIIEGLHVGSGPRSISAANIRSMTDFGSGYQGPNPDISPEYNTAKDVYRYKYFRASKIGLSEEDMYKYMTQDDSGQFDSEYVQASAYAGTALHEYMASLDASKGIAEDVEEYVQDTQHGISGHIDVQKYGMVGDYKTVSPGIFAAINKSNKPKPMHYDQVTFYLGQKGMNKGFIQYINRQNINQQRVFEINFNRRHYDELISKVERTRARVMEDIAVGRLDESDLPMTASPERLEEAASNRLTVDQIAQKLDEHRLIFNEEMEYLRGVKRGMPTSGSGARRIQENRERKKNQSTQGIGLHVFNHRNQHGNM